MSYLRNKGLPLRRSKKGTMVRGQAEKSEDERFLTLDQFKAILKTIQADHDNENRKRDYCAIVCGFYLGLRIGEVAMLKRENFRLLDKGIVFVRRLKQSPRIPVLCGAKLKSGRACGRKFRVSAKKIGKSHKCPACGHKTKIVAENPGVEIDMTPPEKQLPFLETEVKKFLQDYIKEMPDEQDYLLVNHHYPKKRLSNGTFGVIFGSYAMKAGLPPTYSWHSLRHGRGVYLYDNENSAVGRDVKVIQQALGQKSSTAANFYVHLSPERRQDVQRALDGGKKGGVKL